MASVSRVTGTGVGDRRWWRLMLPSYGPPSVRTVLLVTAGLVSLDLLSAAAGDSTLPGGPLDEGAHLLTALLFLCAFAPGASRAFAGAVLVSSVLIDADHIPDRLGIDWLSRGTPRPYTHSLLTIVVFLSANLIWRRRAELLLGVALGLAIHFGRDLTEPGGGISLLWPASHNSFKLPHVGYLAAMALISATVLARASAVHARPRRRQPTGDARLGSRIAWGQETRDGERMHGADELSVGQLRRQLKLGTEAVYRVQDVSGDPIKVEVVSGPGLLAGDTYSLTRAAVLEMEVLQQPGGNSSAPG